MTGRPASRSSRVGWAWLWPYAGFASVLILLLWPAWILQDRLVIGGDTTLIHYPYFVLWRDTLAAGELPFWNRYTFSGIPAFPTLQSGYGYPPHWALSWLPPATAINWLVGLHVLLAGWGAAWCAGRLGASRSGQLLSGLAYALGSAMVARMWAGHLSFLEGNAWLPWATGLALGIGRRGAVIWLALTVALLALAGQPELLIMSAWWLPLWAAGGVWIGGAGRLPRALLRTGLALSFGVGLAAFQLLPVVQLLAVSNRQTGMDHDFATTSSLPPWHLLEALAPLFFGHPDSTYWPGPGYEWHERLLYVGVVPLLAAFRVRGRQRWLCLGAAALAIGLAFGRYLPVYGWTQLLPGYSSFRVPSKHLTLAALALALAGGLGLPRLCGRRVGLGLLILAGLLAGAALTIDRWVPLATRLGSTELDGVTTFGGQRATATAWQGVQLALGLLAGGALLAALPRRWGQGGLLALGLLDLTVTLQPFRLHLVDPLAIIADVGPLREHSRAVVLGDGSALIGNFGPVLRVVQPAGYVSLFSAGYMQLLTGDVNAGVALDTEQEDDPSLRLLGYGVMFDQQRSLLIVIEPPPPLIWVARCVWPGGALEVREPDFPRDSCVTRRAARMREPPLEPGPANLLREGNGWLEAEAEGPGWLVTVQPWYPGWSARVDGAPAPVETVDGALVGVALAPGKHQVRLSYLPAGLELGLLISALSGLLLLLSWWADRPRPGRRRLTPV